MSINYFAYSSGLFNIDAILEVDPTCASGLNEFL